MRAAPQAGPGFTSVVSPVLNGPTSIFEADSDAVLGPMSVFLHSLFASCLSGMMSNCFIHGLPFRVPEGPMIVFEVIGRLDEPMVRAFMIVAGQERVGVSVSNSRLWPLHSWRDRPGMAGREECR